MEVEEEEAARAAAAARRGGILVTNKGLIKAYTWVLQGVYLGI